MAKIQQQVAVYIPIYQQFIQTKKAELQREIDRLQRSQQRQVQPQVAIDMRDTLLDPDVAHSAEIPTPAMTQQHEDSLDLDL